MKINVLKKVIAPFLLLFFVNSLVLYAQTFTLLESVPGNAKDFDNALIFELNGKIFVGAGFYSKKLYEYDVANDSWTARNEIPGSVYSRNSAISFTINGKAYILNGTDINPNTFTSTKLNDFYEYDEVNDSWVSKPLPPFNYRATPGVFVLNNKAYIVGGKDNTTATNTTWEFDGNGWIQKSDFPMININSPSTFVLNGKGYVVCGSTTNGSTTSYTKSLFEYDPVADSWIQRSDFPGNGRYYALGFSASGKGYCGQGSSVNSSSQFINYADFYAYDPSIDSWTLLTSVFPGNPRQSAVAISLGNVAYLGTGWTFISGINSYYKDWYKFEAATTGLSEKSVVSGVSVFPTPTKDILYVELSNLNREPVQYSLINSIGQELLHGIAFKSNFHIDVKELIVGVYILKIETDNNTVSKRILKF